MKKGTQFGSFSADVNPWKVAKQSHKVARASVSENTGLLYQRCIFFFPRRTSSQFGQWVAERMDRRCVPFPRLEWLLLHQSAQMPFNVVRRHGEEPRGNKGNACNTQFPQGTRTQHAHTHMHTLLCCPLKGFPLCGRWINEGVEGRTIELHNGRLGRAAALWGLLPLRPEAAMENTWLQSITVTLLSLSMGMRGSIQRERGWGWLKDWCGLWKSAGGGKKECGQAQRQRGQVCMGAGG